MCSLCGSKEPLVLSHCPVCFNHESMMNNNATPKIDAPVFNKDALLEAVNTENVKLIKLLLQTTKVVKKKSDGWFIKNTTTGKGKTVSEFLGIEKYL